MSVQRLTNRSGLVGKISHTAAAGQAILGPPARQEQSARSRWAAGAPRILRVWRWRYLRERVSRLRQPPGRRQQLAGLLVAAASMVAKRAGARQPGRFSGSAARCRRRGQTQSKFVSDDIPASRTTAEPSPPPNPRQNRCGWSAGAISAAAAPAFFRGSPSPRVCPAPLCLSSAGGEHGELQPCPVGDAAVRSCLRRSTRSMDPSGHLAAAPGGSRARPGPHHVRQPSPAAMALLSRRRVTRDPEDPQVRSLLLPGAPSRRSARPVRGPSSPGVDAAPCCRRERRQTRSGRHRLIRIGGGGAADAYTKSTSPRAASGAPSAKASPGWSQQSLVSRRGNRDQDRGRRRRDNRGGDRVAEHRVPRPRPGLPDDPLLVVAPERIDVPAHILHTGRRAHPPDWNRPGRPATPDARRSPRRSPRPEVPTAIGVARRHQPPRGGDSPDQ